ncbi:MAG TPA: HAD hydrolase family protein [Chitinophagales bacterium]|jgi:3-deoxy-D-manno-octulosonate 8-phosphate phosphatase (KDO 8-P phosphatase)|nr:HAD hydrolase family protein [Chitinophagales bacterium]
MYLCVMMNAHFHQKLHKIKAFVFDVDGVFTNNHLISTESGDLQRIFNAKDGFAIKTALDNGFEVCIITGGTSLNVYKRFEQLGVKHNHYKVKDKLVVLKDFLEKEALSVDEVVYMGDDIPDYEAMNYCGLKCCPNDAVPEIKQIAQYICPQNGGDACVREVIEMVLKVQDKWFKF